MYVILQNVFIFWKFWIYVDLAINWKMSFFIYHKSDLGTYRETKYFWFYSLISCILVISIDSIWAVYVNSKHQKEFIKQKLVDQD